jgi:hypothetical protein
LSTASCTLTSHNTNSLQHRSLLCLNFASCKNGGKRGCEDGLEGDAKREDGGGSTLREEKNDIVSHELKLN